MLAVLAAVCFGVDGVLALAQEGSAHLMQVLLYVGLTLLALHFVVPVAIRRP